MSKISVFFVIISLLFINACSTNAGGYRTASAVEARLMGMTKSEIVSVFGVPTKTIKLDENTEVWSWRSNSTSEWQLVGGACDINVVFNGEDVAKTTINKTDHSPLAAPLGSCSQIIGNLK